MVAAKSAARLRRNRQQAGKEAAGSVQIITAPPYANAGSTDGTKD